MEDSPPRTWVATGIGLVFVGLGAGIVRNVAGAGGYLVPPIVAFGGLAMLFGLSVVGAAWRPDADLAVGITRGIVAASVGLFGISGYVAATSFTEGGSLHPWGGDIASFFLLVGVAGMGSSVLVLLLVRVNRDASLRPDADG